MTALTVLFPEVIRPDKDVGDAYSAGTAVAHIADILNYVIHERCEMLRSLIVIVFEEKQPLGCQSGQVISVAVWQVCRSRRIMQIESAVILCFKPFTGCFQVVALLHLIENLVKSEQLIVRLALFIQKTANILVGCVRIGIDGYVGDILVNEAIDEIRKVQLCLVETVQVLEIFAITLIEGGHSLFKVPVHFEWNVHCLISLRLLLVNPVICCREVKQFVVHTKNGHLTDSK